MTDPLSGFEAPIGDAALELLQPGAHALDSLGALAALEGRPLLGADKRARPASLAGTSWTKREPSTFSCETLEVKFPGLANKNHQAVAPALVERMLDSETQPL
jgi:hypothetical protein